MSWQVLERRVMAGGHGRLLWSKFSSADHSSQGDPFYLASRFKVVGKIGQKSDGLKLQCPVSFWLQTLGLMTVLILFNAVSPC